MNKSLTLIDKITSLIEVSLSPAEAQFGPHHIPTSMQSNHNLNFHGHAKIDDEGPVKRAHKFLRNNASFVNTYHHDTGYGTQHVTHYNHAGHDYLVNHEENHSVAHHILSTPHGIAHLKQAMSSQQK